MTSNVVDAVAPTPIEPPAPEPQREVFPEKINWGILSFMIVLHAMAVVAVVYEIYHFSWWTVGFATFWYACCGFSITGGYHRLFAHPTYRTGWPLKMFHLLFGAASMQNSVLKWASDHRYHHKHVDHDEDPYNIKRSFWWAHIGWIIYESRRRDFRNAKDLQADPLIRFQNRYYGYLAVIMGWVVPMVIGLAWGDPIGAFLLAGFLRLTLQFHATFSINSLAHVLGVQPYSRANSARDSIFTALLTLGEGYHNYHHRFPIDYRNGVRYYQYDPTKWLLHGFSWFGITRDLRRTPQELIDRARAEVRGGTENHAIAAVQSVQPDA